VKSRRIFDRSRGVIIFDRSRGVIIFDRSRGVATDEAPTVSCGAAQLFKSRRSFGV
jgi:hypothetical protein